jgi:hypothetical protein
VDFWNVISREDIRPASGDLLGTGGVYAQIGKPRTVVDAADFVPADGVRCAGWWADRCRVDLFGVASDAGATLRLQLVCGNADNLTNPVVLIDRGVVIPANTKTAPLSLSLGVASGWLAQYWVLLAHVGVGESCEFSARYTLDRGAAGLYAAFGTGTIV